MAIAGKQFPEEYQGDICAGDHGSWNRSVRVGYEVIRVYMRLDTRQYEDFMTGFGVDKARGWGRPVGVAVALDASLLVTMARTPSGVLGILAKRGRGLRP
jgi:glucose/arabinose dehydrogenase